MNRENFEYLIYGAVGLVLPFIFKNELAFIMIIPAFFIVKKLLSLFKTGRYDAGKYRTKAY